MERQPESLAPQVAVGLDVEIGLPGVLLVLDELGIRQELGIAPNSQRGPGGLSSRTALTGDFGLSP